MNACSACRAPILWAITERGKAMPLDAEPDPAGNVILTGEVRRTDHGSAPVAVVLGNTSELFGDPDTTRYMPHHASCPEAERFRRPALKRRR